MGLVARIDTPGAVKLARAIAEFLLERDVDIVLTLPSPGTHTVPGSAV